MRLRNAGRRRQANSPIAALTEVFEPRQLLAAAVVAEANAGLRSPVRDVQTEVTVEYTAPSEGFDLLIDEVRLADDEIHVFSTVLKPKRYQWLDQKPVTHRKSLSVNVPRPDLPVRYHTALIENPGNELYLLRRAGNSMMLFRRSGADESTAWPLVDVEPDALSTVELDAIPAPAPPRGQIARPFAAGSVRVDFLFDQDPEPPLGVSGDFVRRYELEIDRGGTDYPDRMFLRQRSREMAFLGDRSFDGVGADGRAAKFGGQAALNLDFGIYSFRLRKQVQPIYVDRAVDQNAMGSPWSEWTDWSNFTVLPQGHEILLLPALADGSANSVETPASEDVPEVFMLETELPNGTLPEFHWSPVANAASYELWIDSRWNSKKVVHRTGIIGLSETLSEPLELGTYRSWVRATRQDGTRTAWSAARNFQIATPFVTIEPVTDLEDTTPTIRLSGIAGAKSYSITISDVTSWATRQQVYSKVGLRPSAEHTVQTPLRLGRNYEVLITLEFGRGLRSARYANFSLSDLGLPEIDDDARTIRWKSAPDTNGYDVWVAYLAPHFYLHESNPARPAWKYAYQESNTQGVLKLAKDAPGGWYRAWVREHADSGSNKKWSEPVEWSLSGPSERAIQFSGNTFSWKPVDGVTSYTVAVTRKTNKNWGRVDSAIGKDQHAWNVNGTVTQFPEGILPGEYEVLVSYQLQTGDYYGSYGDRRWVTYSIGSATFLHRATEEAVSRLKKEGSAVVWDAIPDAQGYEIELYSGSRLLGSRTDLVENKYELTPKLGAGQFSMVVRGRIVVNGEVRWTAWSTLVFAYGQRTPTNVRFDGSVLHWTGHHTDQSYHVQVSIVTDGVFETVEPGFFKFDFDNKSYVKELSLVTDETSLNLKEILPTIRQYSRTVRLSVKIQSSTSTFILYGDGSGFIPDTRPESFLPTPASDWSVPFEFGLPTFKNSSAPIVESTARSEIPFSPFLYNVRTSDFGTLRFLPFTWLSWRVPDSNEFLNLRDVNGYGLNVDILPRFEYRATNKLTGEVFTVDDANFIKSPNFLTDNFGSYSVFNDDGESGGSYAVDATSVNQSLLDSLSQGIFEIQVRVQHIPVINPGKARPLSLSFGAAVNEEPTRINLAASPWSDWSEPTELAIAPPGQMLLPYMKIKESTNPRPVFQWGFNNDEATYELLVVSRSSGQPVIHEMLNRTRQFQPAQDLVPGVYDWKIRLTGPYPVDGKWSDLQTVEILSAAIVTSVGKPTVDATPVVSWIPVAETNELIVKSYSIQAISKSTGLIVYSATANARATAHRVAEPLPNGDYRILVQAHFVNGARSAPGTPRDDGGFDLPELIVGAAPTGVSVTGLQISWHAVQGTTRYQIWITWINPLTGRPERVVDEAAYSTQFQIPATKVQRQGEYRVWIRAIRHEDGDQYTGAWSKTTVFRIS